MFKKLWIKYMPNPFGIGIFYSDILIIMLQYVNITDTVCTENLKTPWEILSYLIDLYCQSKVTKPEKIIQNHD